jgi:hypothetical protein
MNRRALGLALALAWLPFAAARGADMAAVRCEAVPEGSPAAGLDFHRPPPSDGPTPVDTRLHVIEITDIDVRNGHFQFQAEVDFAWCDPRLAFDAAEHGRERLTFVGAGALEKQTEMWNPDLAFANEVSGIQVRKRELTIRSDGRVRVRGLFSAHLAASYDLRRFPFDSQVLPIQVESFTWDEDVLVLRSDADSVGIRQSFELAEWEVGGVSSRTQRRLSNRGDRYFSRFEMNVAIERRSGYYVWKALLPLTLIVALSWTVFWIPEGLAGRIRLSATVLLTIVAYQFAIAADLPKVSYINLLSAFTTFSFVTVALTVVLNIVVFQRHDRGDETAVQRSDRINRVLVPTLYLIGMLVIALAYLR